MNPTGQQKSATLDIDAYQKRQAILDKPWAECSTDEKLEKVKEELTQLGHLSYSVGNLQTEISKLKEHDHKDGKIVLPLNASVLNGIAASSPGLAGSRRNNLA